MIDLKNWSGNHRFGAPRVHFPDNIEQVQALVRSSGRVKALGSRHSFNDIADSPEDLICLEKFDPAIAIDRERRTVTVNAGVKYGHLCGPLHQAGFGLHNLASLPHISVAGACATATHGSGDENGNLATAVSALEMVTGDGDLVTLTRDRDGDRFLGAVVGLGALGIVTRLTLDLVPTFMVRQDVYENLPLETLISRYDEILSCAYSVSLFTDWRHSRCNQVWIKRRVTPEDAAPEPEFFGAAPATVRMHPISSLSAESCNEQQGMSGPWHERLPHFRMEFIPSNGEELQTEYFVPRIHLPAALRALDSLSDRIAPLLQISEIRTIAADRLWMSPCYGRASVALHFTWLKEQEAVMDLLPAIEAQLAPFEARPHWGKLFAMAPARLQSLYTKLPDFRDLIRAFDPQGRFRNAFLDRTINAVA